MTDLIPVTSWGVKTRHLAHRWNLVEHYQAGIRIGLRGQTLCDPTGNGITGYDQVAVDAYHQQARDFGCAPYPHTITELPLCKRCEKAAAKLQAQT